MPKGSKTCPDCNTMTGPRAYCCKKCNHIFIFKAKSKEAKNTKIIQKINWKELVKGDRIKVTGGPYFVSGSEFIPMGYRGRYVVDSVDSNGILAWGKDRQNGFCHIYMGRDYQNPETKVWKTKHKIVKLVKKVVSET